MFREQSLDTTNHRDDLYLIAVFDFDRLYAHALCVFGSESV